jgi:hypothetical protein
MAFINLEVGKDWRWLGNKKLRAKQRDGGRRIPLLALLRASKLRLICSPRLGSPMTSLRPKAEQSIEKLD